MNTDARQLVAKTMIALLLAGAASTQAAVRYVSLDGSGTDGQSWATAYQSIQKALNDAAVTEGDEIRIKKGLYTVDNAIKVTKAVKILGGYRGVGEERDAEVFTTTLDGGNVAWHGFVVAADAVIDGLTITRGRASYNVDIDGGGMFITDCSATVTHCTFIRNSAYRRGGGLALLRAHGTVIADCTFQENFAGADGGGVYCQESNAAVKGCTFVRNEASMSADGRGGGMTNAGGAPSITGCTFTENMATYGAGMCNSRTEATVESCTFADCDALTACGGGVFNFGGSPTVSKCLFTNNDVMNRGGAILDEFSNGTISDCIMWTNSAMVHGGAVYIGGSADLPTAYPQFVNCTMYGNRASQGGALYSYGCSATLWNCILWGNHTYIAGPGIYNNTAAFTATTVALYCNIEGDGVYPGAGNVCVDPLFEDATRGNLRLQPGSPCIDAGSLAADIATTDYDGNLRVVDGDENGSAAVDLGALEYQGYVEVTGPSRGEILQTAVYDDPADTSATYVFSMRLETNEFVQRIEFRTPNSNSTYEIPNDSRTASGAVTTSHDVRDGKHVWQYRASLDSAAALAAYGDGTYEISLYYRGASPYEVEVPFMMPRSDKTISRPTQKPVILTPASHGAMASPVTATWDRCTDALANTIFLTITDSATGNEVAANVFDAGAAASDTYGLPEGLYEIECAFANLQETIGDDATPFTCGKATAVIQSFEVPYSAVYRFWSPDFGRHFYTISESEKDSLVVGYSDVWSFEGVAYYACSSPYRDGLLPVYRFWSGHTHFYTIDQREHDRLIEEQADIWTPEGIAFYAYPPGAQLAGCVPVYRLWNSSSDTYFYTTNEIERTAILADYGNVFVDQGVAFYAYP